MCRKLIILTVLALGLVQTGVARANLVGHWKFDEGSGTIVVDSSPNGNDGTFQGEPQWVPGVLDGALEFDGDDWVDCGDILNISDMITIACWVNPAGLTDDNGWVARWDVYAFKSSGTSLRFTTPGILDYTATNTVLEVGQWQHVAVTFVPNQTEGAVFYLNGVEAQRMASTAMNAGGGPFVIGNNRWTQYYEGQIDDVRVYHRILKEAQIQDVFNGLEPDFSKAEEPDPADGAIGVTMPLLQWSAGEGAMFHDIYLSTSPDLTEADLVAARQPFTMYYHIQGLAPGTTYHWRVDEVQSDMVTVSTGNVWSFTAMPLTAYVPSPGDGGDGTAQAPILSWLPGQGAAEHHVYFGDDVDAVTDGAAETDKGTVAETTFSTGLLRAGTTYYWRVDEIDTATQVQVGEVWSFTTGQPAEGKVVREWWLGMSGTAINALTGDARYPSSPDGTELVDLFEGPVDWTDNYGTRLYGWLVPPESGDYTFWIAGDDAQELWLSTDEDPANAVMIANVPGYTPARDFDNTGGGSGDADAQMSDPITLQAGQKYYIEALGKEGGGGDSTSVAWQVPGGTREVIPGEFVHTFALPPLKAAGPSPENAAVDTDQSPILSWFAGENATQHDVYFGDDADVVAGADTSAPEYKGGQAGTTYNPGALEWGKSYYWRVDENQADGTALKGTLWSFTTAAFLNVEDFERYTDNMDDGEAIFQTWIDGWENNTGSTVGYFEAIGGTFGERTVVHGGRQSMPLDYNNVNSPYYSETERAFTPPINLTAGGMDTLTLYVRGQGGNDPNQPLYVALEDSAGNLAVVPLDPAVLTTATWAELTVPLSDFDGVNAAAVKKMYIGVGDRDAPVPDGAGLVFIDDIRATKPVTVE